MARTPSNTQGQDLIVLSTDQIKGEDNPSGTGNTLNLRGGNALGGNGDGGRIVLTAGAADSGGAGGNISLLGSAGSGTGKGGDLTIEAGVAPGSGLGGSVTIAAGASTTGTAGNVVLQTTNGAVSIQTSVGFSGIQKETRTTGVQFVAPSGGGTNTILTLGALTINGRNMKFDVSVTAQDNADESNFISFKIITAAWRFGGAVTVLTTPHLTSTEGVAGFITDLTFGVVSVGDNINLVLTNTNGGVSYTLNTAIEWTRQQGGFSA